MARTPAQIVSLRMNSTRPDKYFTEHIPDLFNYKTVLYIGIERYRCVFVKNFLEHGYLMDILEIWEPHVKHYHEANKELKIFDSIYHGDVRNVDKAIPGKKYDVVFWFHGPEHLRLFELPDVWDKLKKMTKKLFVMACPFGMSKSPARGGNIYNEHYCGLYPRHFKMQGFKPVNEDDKRIKAWWRNE